MPATILTATWYMGETAVMRQEPVASGLYKRIISTHAKFNTNLHNNCTG
jgi:hypothetical protein